MTAAAALVAAALLAAMPGTAPAASLGVQTKSPAAGATVSGNIVWEATVSNGTPARVEFLIDGALKWTERGAPYRYNGDTSYLDTRTLSNGSHTLTARAVATTGQTFKSAVTVTVSNSSAPAPPPPPPPPPALAVATSTPAAGATLAGSLVWEAKVTSGTASQVDFLIDGVQKWTERYTPYRFNGDPGSLDTGTLANGSHKLTVRASDSSGKTATSEITVNVSNSASSTANRTVYCVGSSTFGSNGFNVSDATSLGWVRQYPKGLPQRVAFDSSVSLMTGLGCSTVKAEIQPNDPDPNGGTGSQRAQLYSTDSLLSQYGKLPSLGLARGNYRWYGFALATNSGYRPQNSGGWPNDNILFSWHHTGSSGVANIALAVATAGPGASAGNSVGCSEPFYALAQPRLVVEVNGGDPAKYPYNGATCRRIFGPTFTAGARYTLQMGIKWADDGTGSFELWINDQQVASVANVSTMWTGQSVYPILENYRPGKAMIGNMITWTNTVYYAGLVAGPTRADAALPSS
jgi:Big-like domain-containing protein/polysaccharide lyase-like protein